MSYLLALLCKQTLQSNKNNGSDVIFANFTFSAIAKLLPYCISSHIALIGTRQLKIDRIIRFLIVLNKMQSTQK